MALTCSFELKPIGKTCEDRFPIAATVGLFLLRPGFSGSATDWANRDWVLQNIIDGNIFPLQRVKGIASEDVDDNIVESDLNDKIFNNEGKRGALYSTSQSLESHKILRTYNGYNFDLVRIDVNKTIILSKKDDGTYGGVELQYFRAKKLNTIGAGEATYSQIQVQELDNEDLDTYGYYFIPTWNPKRIYGPNYVGTTSSAVASNAFTSVVKYTNNGRLAADGTAIEQAITGLVAANFKLIDQTGATLTPVTDYTVTESPTVPGTYTIDATVGGLTSGSVQVIATTTNYYFSDAETLSA